LDNDEALPVGEGFAAWFPCEASPVPESVGDGAGLVGAVPLGLEDGDDDGLDDWTADAGEVGDEDGLAADVDGDGDCGVAVGLAVPDPVGHAVDEVVAYGRIAVGIELGVMFPGPGAAVEPVLELPPVDVYWVAAAPGDAVGPHVGPVTLGEAPFVLPVVARFAFPGRVPPLPAGTPPPLPPDPPDE
jgi:hypothetical protein